MARPTPAFRHAAFMYGAVFIGGAAGSMLREVFAVQVLDLPYLTSTFGVNIAACLLLGWLYAIRNRVHAHVLHLGAVGFCGGLSTFSSFVLELDRITSQSGWTVLVAMAAEVIFGLAAAMIGEAIGRRFHSKGRQG